MRIVSPAGARARLSVMIFHRVLAEQDALFPDEVHAPQFEQICTWTKSWFNVLVLEDAVARLKAGTLPERAACITFDDGYADNHDIALPILRHHGVTATFFVATGFLDGGCMWNDILIEAVRRTKLSSLALEDLLGDAFADLPVGSLVEKQQAVQRLIRRLKYLPVAERALLANQVARVSGVQVPADLMMTSAKVVAMRRAGMSIGAHTVSHPILARLSRAGAVEEIGQSKRTLEHLLNEPVQLFAYPNGKPDEDYNAESMDVVRALGFEAAVSTRWGVSNCDTDLFQIPRFTPWDRTRLKFGARLAANMRRL